MCIFYFKIIYIECFTACDLFDIISISVKYKNMRCKYCQKDFKQRQKSNIYCSKDCYHKSTKTGNNVICKYCKKSFYTYNKRKRAYCSVKCYRLAKAIKTITKICPVCNKSFIVTKSISHRYKVCSLQCRHKFRTKSICPTCGKIFNDNRGKRTHCSEECRRPIVKTTCVNCSKEFRIVPSQKGIRRFCSFSCYRKYCGETTIEKTIRETLEKLGIYFIQECQIKSFSIDFFIPVLNICLETDGDYWHNDPVKDKRRDKKLKELGYKVVRLKEFDINNANNLDDLVITCLKFTSLK